MCTLNEAEITNLGPKEDVPIITFWTTGETPWFLDHTVRYQTFWFWAEPFS